MHRRTTRTVSALLAIGVTAASAVVAFGAGAGDSGSPSAGGSILLVQSVDDSVLAGIDLDRERDSTEPASADVIGQDLERATLSARAAEQDLAEVQADQASELLESIKAERVGAAEQATRAEERERILAAPPRELGQFLAAERGYTGSQWSCLESLWQRESNWNPSAQNRSSGAYGIPQALPGSKMATVADDWRTNPVTQITWGLNYIEDRYGTPCGAWGHSQSHGWY